MENNRTTNRLASEKSPYLQQHADNPVDWYTWGQEAFEKAKKENKPIFLSIGYSTCHWCHVMAHESFEDEEVARILNRGFVAIKVDREERPDIDSVYMSACQALTGSGGWPLTIVMTPEKEPFFAGTYFPKRGRGGSVGLIELLQFIDKTWKSDKKHLVSEGRKVTDFIRENVEHKADQGANEEQLLQTAREHFAQSFDERWGGFGPMPKFPSPHNLLFLMEQGDEHCMAMAEKTLIQMYRGGLYDHIGGGFCRYSTDERWLAPHFEKMLYDNAMLLLAYTDAYQKTGKLLYAQVARETAGYVKRELTDEHGGFFCGQDADSDGIEGKYYVFSPGEIIEVLGETDGAAFCERFDITAKGNFEGKSIPNRIGDEHYEIPEENQQLEQLRRYRKERAPLHKDDKILTGWNGLMIAALARAARVLDRQDYLQMAKAAVDLVWDHLQQDGHLWARWRQGEAAHPGTLDDYAFFTWGLLECYRSTLETGCLERATQVGEHMLEQFYDWEHGGCFLYGKDSEQLFVRPKEAYDGAIPSGNSAAALVMREMAFYTGKELWHKAWEKQRDFMNMKANSHPASHSFFLLQLIKERRQGSLICVTVGDHPPQELERIRKEDLKLLVKTKANCERLESIAPFLSAYAIPQQGEAYYLCQGHQCSPPVSRLEEIYKL